MLGETKGNSIIEGDASRFLRFAGIQLGRCMGWGKTETGNSRGSSTLFLLLVSAISGLGEPCLVPMKFTKMHNGRRGRWRGISGSGGGMKLGYFFLSSSNNSVVAVELIGSHASDES
jgi:hypothetical protein